MLLAIGDVVRIRRNEVLGTVAGLGTGVVALHVNGQTTCTVPPQDIEVVARGSKPPTPARGVAALVFIVLGVVVAVLNGDAVHQLGSPPALTLFVAFTSATSVAGGLFNLFLRPRRIRV